MATAAQVVKAALNRILVRAADAPLEADEYQDAVFAMNNYMLALDADGVSLGYTVVSDLGDDVTIPPGALRGLIANLAIEMAPDFGGVVSDALAVAAREGEKVMRKVTAVKVGPSSYPGTLQRGSGNYCDGWVDDRFYTEPEDVILAETTGSIALEVSTEDEISG